MILVTGDTYEKFGLFVSLNGLYSKEQTDRYKNDFFNVRNDNNNKYEQNALEHQKNWD